jgi:membrane-bound inhibitor of C-type lysozyme
MRLKVFRWSTPARRVLNSSIRVDVPYNELARLFLASGTITLARTVSASGGRFSDGVTSYWNKGDEAFFEVDGH